MRSHRYKGIILAFLAGLLWGTIGIFVKKLTGLTPMGTAFFRLLVAFVGIISIVTYLNLWEELKSSLSYWKFLTILSFIMSLSLIFAVSGFYDTTVANASILNNTTPLYIPLFGLLIWEKTNKKEWLGILLGFFGILLIFSTHGISFESQRFIGNVFSIMSAIFLAVYTILSKKIRLHFSSFIIMFWVFGLGSLFIFLESIFFQKSFFLKYEYADFYYVLGLGIFGTFLAHTFYTTSLKYIKASTASLIGLSSPISATLYAMILLREIPPILTLLGLAFSITGIFYVIRSERVINN
ncbi:hypothetical protein A3J15_00980 [Candidatus Roizmanbacteria bacterium RIFCSPLOWO2_02_FULL_38_10]|uniref:EamA domain-containing protein n=1 Tax=Candidatus Roizmanbacteria bacterium RIFCSPLOWO2_02_FULL_38_10 TaxID=1802074 RepID=A0A1F7JLY9_9BACT|nr:MAG: hypothetical protein A3J15_00980 [Candidatus Roizmanbacteria bacterium RIFCSPLOWO2_02_FULL_38_10]